MWRGRLVLVLPHLDRIPGPDESSGKERTTVKERDNLVGGDWRPVAEVGANRPTLAESA